MTELEQLFARLNEVLDSRKYGTPEYVEASRILLTLRHRYPNLASTIEKYWGRGK